ncbi:MAG: T9SS type A sorting domain-containing protein [Flavobacteriales bacterium]|nr:T9SS type A sorting domain-containing protein [Flavobacteriales bacterium]
MLRHYTSLLGLFLAVLLAPLTAQAQPANDDCAGAIELFPGASCVPVSGTVAGATASLPGTVLCDGFNATPDDDVWYKFTATSSVHQIRVQGSPNFDAVIQLLEGACNGSPIICRDIVSAGGVEILDVSALTIGQQYLIRVFHWSASVPATTTFSICVGPSLVPPNDNCVGAIELVPNPTCNPTAGSILGATLSAPATSCGGSPNDDVWFRFTATSDEHTVRVATLSGFDAVVDLRTGACNGTSIQCVDVVSSNSIENLNATGLTIGENYYVRVYHFGSNVPANSGLQICILGPEPLTCDADAGTLTADAGTVCLVEGSATLTATPDGNENVPANFETVYVLTQGPGLVIVNAGATPSFDVTSADAYTIHTLVYDPTTLDLGIIEIGVTTGFDVNALLIQGGGDICGSLDVAGAPVTVEECVTCDADAGTLTADAGTVCLVEGSATLTATPDGNENVPANFETVYVLTQGPGLVIVNAGATPSFDVTSADAYTIHTLVYDPTTLDLGIIEIGVTTGFDVNALLIQGGGDICGSLDVAGAPVTVEECVTCDADAGAISAEPVACLEEGMAMFSGTPDGNSVVPEGFETLYVLTQGEDLVIIDAAPSPDFMVTAIGDYTIHTLVYDPNTLDLGIIEIGVTTGFDVNALLIQGGGDICGSLDVAGAPVSVQVCIQCDAVAGTITADASFVCFVDDMAVLTATPNGDIVIPDGFETIFVLTQGVDLVIVDAASSPDFMVNDEGSYTIHTLVYDPNTLDLGLVEFGVTTGFDVNALLIQGGGEICASLDVVGAPFTVQVCVACEGGDVTTANGATSVNICQDSEADVIDFATTSTSTNNYTYALTDDNGRIVTLLAGNALDFNSAAAGTYQVWGISYDGSLVGAEFGADIAGVTNTGTCLELSASFVTVTVEICIGVAEADQLTWGIYPNPTEGLVTLNYRGADTTVNIEVVDMGGRVVAQDGRAMTNGQRHTMDLGAFAPGMYTVRLTSGQQVTNLRVVVR